MSSTDSVASAFIDPIMSTTDSMASKIVDPVAAAGVAAYIYQSGALTPTKVCLYVMGGAAIAGGVGFAICYFLATRGYFERPKIDPTDYEEEEKQPTEIPITVTTPQ